MAKTPSYSKLIANIGTLLQQGRIKAAQQVNSVLVQTYWQIGREITEFELQGKERADYGSRLLTRISKDLKDKCGKGFSKSNVYLMRQFYQKYPKFQTVSGKLSYSHYAELLSLEEDLKRGFYLNQCINDHWSVRELQRQINSGLFERIALSKSPNKILKLAEKGQVIEKAEDAIKDPYILEFLGGTEISTEKELEQRIIDNLKMFLLELGKGFSFVSRQFRITLDNNHYYVDLVFYHRILKCYILIDLKIGKVSHKDVGQMNMYLNYFKEEENKRQDANPIGIILAGEKNNLIVKYALGGLSNKLFVSKYKLYLPDRKELQNKLRNLLQNGNKTKVIGNEKHNQKVTSL